MNKTKFVYTALMWTGEHWTEAYGYLGSYYKTYRGARFEIDFLMSEFSHKYKGWAIERIALDKNKFRVRDPLCVVLAHSKDAPIHSLHDERQI